MWGAPKTLRFNDLLDRLAGAHILLYSQLTSITVKGC